MSENPNSAPLRGKLTRLPLAIREMLCERLLNGDPGRVILPWVNALPGVIEFLAAEYNGEKVNEANLSAFRQGYYQKWLAGKERVERTRQLAKLAAQHSRADGGNIAAGAASVLAGKLMEVMERIDEASDEDNAAKLDPQELVKLAASIAAIRTGDQNDEKLAHEKRKIEQKDEELKLAREKFQRESCELFVKWAAEKAALEIASSEATNADKIEKLGQLMFGETWKAQTL